MDITPENIKDWLIKSEKGRLIAPTCYHLLHSEEDVSEYYDAYKNPPDVTQLACAYLNLADELQELKELAGEV